MRGGEIKKGIGGAGTAKHKAERTTSRAKAGQIAGKQRSRKKSMSAGEPGHQGKNRRNLGPGKRTIASWQKRDGLML